MSDISTAIQQLVNYGLDTGLILPDDEIYIRNQLLMTMQLDSFTAPEGEVCYTDLESILKTLLDDAVARGVCADNSTARDLFDTKLMGVLTPRPSIVRANFEERYENEGPQAATDWFYQFSQDTDYIRRYRIKRDLKWVTNAFYHRRSRPCHGRLLFHRPCKRSDGDHQLDLGFSQRRTRGALRCAAR